MWNLNAWECVLHLTEKSEESKEGQREVSRWLVVSERQTRGRKRDSLHVGSAADTTSVVPFIPHMRSSVYI